MVCNTGMQDMSLTASFCFCFSWYAVSGTIRETGADIVPVLDASFSAHPGIVQVSLHP